MNGWIQHGYCIRFAGPSHCGKTSMLCKLLASKEQHPCPPKRVMWVSGSGAPNESIESKIKTIYTASQFFLSSAWKYFRDGARIRLLGFVTRSHNCAYQVYFNNKVDCHWIRVLGDQLTSNYKQFASMFKEAMKCPMIPCYVIIVKPRCQWIIYRKCLYSHRTRPTYFMVPHIWKTAHLRSKDFDNE